MSLKNQTASKLVHTILIEKCGKQDKAQVNVFGVFVGAINIVTFWLLHLGIISSYLMS